MAGRPGPGLDKARSLIADGAQIVVYKMGEKGAVTITREGEFATGIYPTQALKPTGAGDSFLGRVHRRPCATACPSGDAVLRGSAAAAMVVARVGCAPAMPTGAELDAFLATHPGPPPERTAMHIAPHDNQNRPIVDVDDALVPLVYFNIVTLKAGETFRLSHSRL